MLPPSEEEQYARAVSDSWKQLQQAGRYEFSSTVEQTTYPAPKLSNVGRSKTTERYYVSGESDLSNETMLLSLYQNQGSLLNQRDGIEIRVEGDQAWGRGIGSEWQALEDFSGGLFAPANDAASFLVAARNIHYLDSMQTSIALPDGTAARVEVDQYSFELDSEIWAGYMRDQLVQELQRAGKLPAGMHLSASDRLRGVTASGEVWLDQDGLPARLKLHMVFPQERDGQRVEASIRTDFFNHARENLLAHRPLPWRIAGALGLPTTRVDLQQLVIASEFALGVILFIGFVVVYSRKRYVYALIAVLVILSMLITPLWQGVKAASLFDELQAQRQEQEAQQEKARQDQEATQQLLGSDWNPAVNPLEASAAAQPALAQAALRSASGLLANNLEQGVEDASGSDTDEDGLTDDFEMDFWGDSCPQENYGPLVITNTACVLNPWYFDTDGDGLTDNQELKLNTISSEADSDGDGITDLHEVQGFEYEGAANYFNNNNNWYSNPGNKDTDHDGKLDGAECYERVIRDGNPTPGVCQDTDDDGVPDIFDSDDDGDGVPSAVDASPYYASPDTHDINSPFKFEVANLATDEPVFITYQLLPTEQEHLTYALNVLDWPSGDNDGQIQRVAGTTFGDSLSPEALEGDPRAAYGDLRLMPMIEIKLTGTTLPLPLTTTMTVPISNTNFSDGEFLLQSDSGATQVELSKGPAGAYPVYHGVGFCDDFTGLGKVGDLSVGGGASQADLSLGDFADGGYVLYVMNAAETSILACAETQPVAHGQFSDYLVDDAMLAAYGGSARNDSDGGVLVYAPLSLVTPYDGSVPVAFQVELPFTNVDGGFSDSVQNISAIWLLNMLTDECKPRPDDWDDESMGDWCDASELDRWNVDDARVVHTYNEEFTITGLSVRQEYGIDMAVVFEDPAIDPEPGYDDPLWALSQGLERSFAAGRPDSLGALDITVEDIEARFDPDNNSCTAPVPGGETYPYVYREDNYADWGLPCNAFQVERFEYPYQYGVIEFMRSQVKDEIFEQYFNSLPEVDRPNYTNLLFARQMDERSVIFGESAVTLGTTYPGVWDFDFGSQDLITYVVMNWAPYQRDADEWSSYPLEDYLDQLEANLRQLDSYQPADESLEAKYIIDGQIMMARMYYEGLWRGVAALVALNGDPLVNEIQLSEDQYIYDDFYRLQAKAQAVTKVVVTLTDMIVDTWFKYPLLYGLVVTPLLSKFDRVQAFFITLYQGVVDKVSAIGKYLTSTVAKVAVGAVVGLIVVAVAVSALLYFIDSDSMAGKIGGSILFGAIGLVSAALAIKALYSVYNVLKGVEAASKGASAAAIIGLIVGIIITWGVFFVSWGLSGAKPFSLALNSLFAEAIAATFTVVVMTVIAVIFPVGTIIAAVIGLIDALIASACAIARIWSEDMQEDDHWANQYICVGITGWVTKIAKWFIYSNTYLIDYDNADRLQFTGLSQDFAFPLLGMTVSNAISVTVSVSNTIKLSDIPIDWKAAAYAWQYTDKNARSSAFEYLVQPEETDIHEDLERYSGDGNHGWTNLGDHRFAREFLAMTDDYSIAMPEAGINRDPTVIFSEGSAVPVQECTVIPVPNPLLAPPYIPVPECHIRTERATIHAPIGDSLTLDVFPADLDGFYELAEMESGGYSLAWGRADPGIDETGLTFTTFKDADGDGLKSPAFNGNDPNDSEFDSDGDGVGDYYEISEGLNPRLFDTDGDSLWDSQEVQLGSDPTRMDSDGDGLPDNEEVQGWLFTYGFDEYGQPLETMVFPALDNVDTDFDGLTDLLEKVYGFNPQAPQDSDVLNYVLSTRELDSPLVLLRLDEPGSAATFEDSSGFGFNATCLGDACPMSGVDGRFSKAISLDGGQEYLSLPTSAKAISFVDNQPFTLAAWVNWDGGAGTILSKWSEVSQYEKELRFDINNAGKLKLTNSGGSAVTSGDAVASGTWQHVAAAFDGSQVSFYIDGSSAGGGGVWSTPATSAISDTQVTVGAYLGASGATSFFDGKLDEVAIFDYALSTSYAYDRPDLLFQARYNLNDSYVRPGEQLTYKTVIENLLNSRFAYGLLTTLFNPREAIVDWATKMLPFTFELWPDNPAVTEVNTVVISDTLQIDPAYTTSGDLTIDQTASAQILDRRAESNFAELWLKLNEGSAATEFEDSSGNMPPRYASCASCPARGETGILGNAVKFRSGENTPIDFYRKVNDTDSQRLTLDWMQLIDRGYTIALWVKPPSPTVTGEMTLLDSTSDALSLSIEKRGSNNDYMPRVKLNGTALTLNESSFWRALLPGVWSHLVLRYSSTTQNLDIFVNGARVLTKTSVNPLPSSAADAELWLGGSPQGADYWVDDVRIFSRPISELDINLLAERPVLKLNMDQDPGDSNYYDDDSAYSQSVSTVHSPTTNSQSVRGQSLSPYYFGAPFTYNRGYLKVDGNKLLDLEDANFTFSTWIYPTSNAPSSTDWQGVFGYNSGQTYAYPSLDRRGLQLRFGFGDDGSTSAWRSQESGDVLMLNKWNHVVVTFRPREVSGVTKYEYILYVDGEPVDSNLFDQKPANADRKTFFVGHSSHRYTSSAVLLHVDDIASDPGDYAEVKVLRYEGSIGDNDPADCIYKWDDDECKSQSVQGVNNYTMPSNSYTSTTYETIRYRAIETDWAANPDDQCGSAYHYWYDPSGNKDLTITNGIHGYLRINLQRQTILFYGYIDELEVYRYAIDRELVEDLYNAIPVTARLPLNERPASDTFENRAFIGQQRDGTCTLGVDCPAAGTIGLINQAVRFDGDGDLIKVPVDTTSDYMLSLWFNTEHASSGLYTLQETPGGSTLNQLYMHNGNVCAKTGATLMCSAGDSLADGQWHHVVYANNGSYANLWLDGAVVNTITGGATVAAALDGQALLGYAPDAVQTSLDGQLDDVRIYRYTQSGAEVARLRQRAPLALFHLDEPHDSTQFEDATTADWLLACSGGCPQAEVEGRLSTAVEFDGVNDRLRLSQPKLSDSAQSFSIGVWVKPTRDAIGDPQTLWNAFNSGNTDIKYAIITNPGSLNLCVLTHDDQDACSEAEQSKVALIQNVWNFVVLTVERLGASETYSLYINGYLDSTGDSTYINNGLGRLMVGNKPASGYSSLSGGPFGGVIDEVSVYEYLLNEIDVRDAFHYQMAQVEEHTSLTLTIDADQPQVELVSYNSAFPYINADGQELQVDASDATSGVAMVEMKVEHVTLSEPVWEVAPLCDKSGSGASFCPYFNPLEDGNGDPVDGKYTLTFRVVDRVGHQATSPAYDVYVDAAGPVIRTDFDGDLLAARLHPSRKHTWTLHLSGSMLDEVLENGGDEGSGVDTSTVWVTAYSAVDTGSGEAAGAIGAGTQVPALTETILGYDWEIDYLFPEVEPSGNLRVLVQATDKAGNPSTREFYVLLDATPSHGKLQSGNLPQPDLATMMRSAADETPILSSGTLSGTISDIPTDDLPYITLEGKNAAFGVEKVETAFTPDIDVSYLFNEPYPAGLLAWLPLDNSQPPVDENGDPDPDAETRLFLDISPQQAAGECYKPDCPQAGVEGHKMGSTYFFGSEQYITLGQQVDLANRSFTVSIWAKRDQIDRNDPILWQGPLSMPDLRFLFGLNSQNRLVCGFGGADLVSAQDFPDNLWHYWACTYDLASGARAIYRDGQIIGSDAITPIPAMFENLNIGLSPVGSFKGYLDELVVIDRSLSAEEIRAQYVGYNMVYHLAVDENYYANGDLLPDHSGYFHLAELLAGEGDLDNKATAGKVGNYALAFDGNDQLAIPEAPSLNPDWAAFTQSAWIYPTGGTGERDVISERDENPEMSYPSIILTGDNRLKVGFGDFYNWRAVETTPDVVAENAWNFVAASFDGTTYRIYVNGELVLASNALAGLIPYASLRFNIGEGFQGEIDDVRLYMRPLTDLEIQALMGIDWREAALQGAGQAEATWSASLVNGLEGPYHIGVRGWDSQGHYDTGRLSDDQWGGVVDTLAPRIAIIRQPDPPPTDTFTVTYTFSIEDTMLDEASIMENMCAGEVQLERQYYNSSWYLSKGAAPNTLIYRVLGTCQGDRRTFSEVGVYACDAAGNCASETFPPYYTNAIYLPLVVKSGDAEASAQPVARLPEPEPARPPQGAQKLVERALSSPSDEQPPRLAIYSREISPSDARSLVHFNLQGTATDENGVAWVKIRILQAGQVVYETRAAVYGDLWNAMWVFPPGQAPLGGVYTLEVSAADLAGNQSTSSQEFTVRLSP
ncbi:MAG: Ig-like domain repeat protein [Anaerolineales bacterium]|nr:Ig-like domain repeat protein [Anaerolineales bacterium]